MTRETLQLGLLAIALSGACVPSPGPSGGESSARPATAATVATSPTEAAASGTTEVTEAAKYVGSEACAPCHLAIATEWKASSHATTVRLADYSDEEQVASFIECSDLFVTHVLGDRHHVRFLVRDDARPWGEGRFLAIPCGWDVHEKEVTLHNPDDWEQLPFETGCAGCHVTGFRAEDHSFLEIGVGCEECHGPGSLHAVSARKDATFLSTGRSARDEVLVCASCHLQGGRSKSTGLKLAPTYQPGDDLFDDYEFDWSELDPKAADALVLDLHQKIVVRDVVLEGDERLRCTSCHELHRLGHEKHRLVPQQDTCFLCHEPDLSLKEYSQSCNVCEF